MSAEGRTSVAAHLAGKNDGLVTVRPILGRTGDFKAFLAQEFDEEEAYAKLRHSETIGRPLGDDKWIEKLEIATGRQLKPQKRGPKGERQKGK